MIELCLLKYEGTFTSSENKKGQREKVKYQHVNVCGNFCVDCNVGVC